MSDAKTNTLTVTVGEYLFEFRSFEHWVAKASGWFRSYRVRSDDCIGIDTAGRICPTGKQYMRARDEGTFPIRVYRAVVETEVPE